jgi:hypothetical protein
LLVETVRKVGLDHAISAALAPWRRVSLRAQSHGERAAFDESLVVTSLLHDSVLAVTRLVERFSLRQVAYAMAPSRAVPVTLYFTVPDVVTSWWALAAMAAMPPARTTARTSRTHGHLRLFFGGGGWPTPPGGAPGGGEPY